MLTLGRLMLDLDWTVEYSVGGYEKKTINTWCRETAQSQGSWAHWASATPPSTAKSHQPHPTLLSVAQNLPSTVQKQKINKMKETLTPLTLPLSLATAFLLPSVPVFSFLPLLLTPSLPNYTLQATVRIIPVELTWIAIYQTISKTKPKTKLSLL